MVNISITMLILWSTLILNSPAKEKQNKMNVGHLCCRNWTVHKWWEIQTVHHQCLNGLPANDISIFGKDWWSKIHVGFNTAHQLET